MKNRILILTLIITFLPGTLPAYAAGVNRPAAEAPPPGVIDKGPALTGEIIIDGAMIEAPPPYIYNDFEGVVMLPLRALAENLGIGVVWLPDEQSVILGGDIQIWIGKDIYSRGQTAPVAFGPAPELSNGFTYIPLPFVNHVLTGYNARLDDGRVVINTLDTAADPPFIFGKAAHAIHPETVDAFVPVFAEEMARYDRIAPLCWPDNAVTGKTVVLEDIDTNRFWLVSAAGAVTELTGEAAAQMGVLRRETPDDFSFYEDGMYISVSDQSVKDQFGWDKPHVGAYDAVLWLTHEGFHKWEQGDKWAYPDAEDISNTGREEFFLDIAARTKRHLLQTQLLKAVAEPGDNGLVLDALSTFLDYKTQNAGDYENALYYDRIEGTALYFEMVSSLYIFYPDQINGGADIERAFAYLAREYEENYIRIGVISESYYVGMLACVLLDRADENWKERVMREPAVTPLELLFSHYKDTPLPEPKQPTREETDRVTEGIRDKIRMLVERQVPLMTGLKSSLAGLPEAERAVYAAFLDDMLRKFVEMITVLTEEEQKAQEDFIISMSD